MRLAAVSVFSVILASACGDATLGGSAGATGGRLVVHRLPDGVRLLEAPARAQACETDSTLAIIAMTRAWSVAIGLRTAWPLAEASSFRVRGIADSLGTGALAARALSDSVQPALTAYGGSLGLEPGVRASGRFEVVAAGPTWDTVTLAGEFQGIPITTGLCPP